MPTGTVAYDSFSATSSSDDAQVTFTVSASATTAGVNVVSVSVHNRAASSSDLSFDMSIFGLQPPAALPITFGSAWSYMADGSDQGIAWTDPAFDDTTWNVGPAQLGFGDGDESTVFSFRTAAAYYFRKKVALASQVALSAILLFDDGAVVYVNGIEVSFAFVVCFSRHPAQSGKSLIPFGYVSTHWCLPDWQVYRTNMPTGTITSTTWASRSSSDDQEESFSIPLSATVAGINTIAVSVHNRRATSSDISFDLAVTAVSPPSNLLPLDFGATWRYKADGSNQGTAWRNSAFDDTNWQSGAAELGFGDGDEVTTFAHTSAATYYFRKTFSVASPIPLLADLIYDDAAIVYINGIEVFRDNIGSGTVVFDTFATSTSSDNEEASISIDSGFVLAGTNVLAVEVHNRPGSSDVSFDFALIAAPHDPAVVNHGAVWRYFDGVSGTVPTGWTSGGSAFNDASWSIGAAGLGYGESDVVTELSYGSSASSKPITVYFRRVIDTYALVTSTGTSLRNCVAAYTGSLIVDDGAVVYINGIEVRLLVSHVKTRLIRIDPTLTLTYNRCTVSTWELGLYLRLQKRCPL